MDNTRMAEVHGFGLRPLALPADRDAVAELADACRDFSELIEGEYTGADAAVEDIFHSLPPEHTLADKVIWGVSEAPGRLAGVVDMIRGYHHEKCVWIGLFMLRPERRGDGLGVAVLSAIIDWAAAQGFTELGLAVAEQNEPAQRFWQRQGFVEFRRRLGVVMGKRTNNLIAMKRAIP